MKKKENPKNDEKPMLNNNFNYKFFILINCFLLCNYGCKKYEKNYFVINIISNNELEERTIELIFDSKELRNGNVVSDSIFLGEALLITKTDTFYGKVMTLNDSRTIGCAKLELTNFLSLKVKLNSELYQLSLNELDSLYSKFLLTEGEKLRILTKHNKTIDIHADNFEKRFLFNCKVIAKDNSEFNKKPQGLFNLNNLKN